jgi:hexulose-6-phosphate isomerase
MEGRLLPPEPGRFQSFPRSRWADEFELAKAVPLNYIEWIYDAYGADVNPLTNDVGTLVELSRSTGVAVRSLCADYFMEFPLIRCSREERAERLSILSDLLSTSGQLGLNRIVIPFVDASRIENSDEEGEVVQALSEVLPVARTSGVEIHLETSLPPDSFAGLLSRIPDSMVKVNYDSGNSASLGFDPREEFAAYGRRVGSVHIKDRRLAGTTVPLGTGDCDFDALFQCLAEFDYRGDITLQVARGVPGDEVAWTRENRAFVERFWPLD